MEQFHTVDLSKLDTIEEVWQKSQVVQVQPTQLEKLRDAFGEPPEHEGGGGAQAEAGPTAADKFLAKRYTEAVDVMRIKYAVMLEARARAKQFRDIMEYSVEDWEEAYLDCTELREKCNPKFIPVEADRLYFLPAVRKTKKVVTQVVTTQDVEGGKECAGAD